MKANKRFYWLLALPLLLLAAWFILPRILPPAGPALQRFSLVCQDAQQELFFDQAAFVWRSAGRSHPGLGTNISRGTGMLLGGQGRFRLKPGLRGERGFQLSLQFKSWDARGIAIRVTLEGDGTRVLAEFEGRSGYQLISRVLKLTPKSEIVITARGDGVVLAGEPVFYAMVARPERKYVFLIAPDTLRGDRIGMKRKGRSLTPHVDGFKKDAATFIHCFAQSSWTLPSFVSLFTGLYEHHHQARHRVPLAPGKAFLGESLAPAFVTAVLHGGGWLGVWPGFSRGIDYFAQKSRPVQSDGGRRMFSAAGDFLARNPVPALFMLLHTYQVHAPYSPPGEFLRLLNERPRHLRLASFTGEKQYLRRFTPELRQDMEELYDGEVLAFDHYFGEFIARLKSLGIYEQSMIVLLSDHGEEFDEHGGWAHGHSMYDEVLRVPLLIKFPGNRFRGRSVPTSVALIDVMPTMLDGLGMVTPAGLDGASLLPLLERKSGRERVFQRNEIFSTLISRIRKFLPAKFAILFGRHKLIYNFPLADAARDYFAEFGPPPDRGRIELYDLKSDPLEKVNLYPGKMGLPASIQAAIREMVGRFGQSQHLGQEETAGLSPEERAQLETLGYL